MTFRHNCKDWAARAPLVAALLAPLSTLLEIPALTQRWYTYYGVPVPDAPACVALSAIGLAFNFLANVLLIIRFSPISHRWWGPATTASTILWTVKTIVAIVNLSLFGIWSRNGPGYAYTEGFWCEVSAAVFSGVIALLLIAHYFLAYGKKNVDRLGTRLQGRHFMGSISFLMFVIGVQALIYSRIQHWSYFDGIYFCVVTMLTIGFGDEFVPTYTSTRVLLLPFSILTISQLANEVAMIIDYFSVRTKARRQRWRDKYENSIRELQRQKNPHASLEDEVELLEEISNREELMAEVWDLAWSLGSLIVFWMAGAAIFSAIEPGWTFGDALYFQVVFCLTIGYGDLTPTTPGSRVFWVIYALMAVPLIASFAVQAVTGLLSTFSQRRLDHTRKRRAKRMFHSAFTQHKDLVLRHRNTFNELLSHEQAEPDASPDHPIPTHDDQATLLSEIIDAGIRLEAVGRKLLIDALPRSSLGRSILEADRNLQLRDVKAAGGDSKHVGDLWREEDNDEKGECEQSMRSAPTIAKEHAAMLSQIRRYRDTFAQFLVAASKAQGLDGKELFQFERWQQYEEEDEKTQVEQSTSGRDEEEGPAKVPGTHRVIHHHLKQKIGSEQPPAEKSEGPDETEEATSELSSNQGKSKLTEDERAAEKRRLEKELAALPLDTHETEDNEVDDEDPNEGDLFGKR